jgi:hypothetical protein
MFPSKPNLRRGLLAATLAASVAGCGDSTGPDEARIVIDATEEQLLAAHVMVDDVTGRLFPSIAQLSGVAELNAAVSALASAVSRADAEAIDENASLAADALAQVRAASTEAEAADLSAIDLAVDEVTRLLKYPTNSPSNLRTRR